MTVLINSEGLLRLFRDDPEVVSIGLRTLRLQASAQLLLPICMTSEMLFQSTDRRAGALLLSVMRNGLFMIPTLVILEKWRSIVK